ncbi:MAG: succinylglutamate desuccinylase/aspartoacylase family protein [Oligoflexus sp.]
MQNFKHSSCWFLCFFSFFGSLPLLATSEAPLSPIDRHPLERIIDKNKEDEKRLRQTKIAKDLPPKAESIDLKEVVSDPSKLESEAVQIQEETSQAKATTEAAPKSKNEKSVDQTSANADKQTNEQKPKNVLTAQADGSQEASAELAEPVGVSKFLLGVEVPPATATRLSWTPAESFGDLTAATPVLVVNGSKPGTTLCLVAAVHGDELNGIEMIRRIVYSLEPEKLTGTVIGVPIVNLMAFRRSSRYLPDRRDLNRYFPGNPQGSAASRIAASFFSRVIKHCDVLVDLHTGSFHRTNLTQLRADLSDQKVAELSQHFGSIAVLNGRGHQNSLRAAAVRAGIPAVTMEAGEPLRLQNDIVTEGTKALEALLHKLGMYKLLSFWSKPAPIYYRSVWVRADQGGFLFSRVTLGQRVMAGEVLGVVTDPITNSHTDIISPHQGRVLGMALDQLVLPGFATYHIGIQTPEERLIEESQKQNAEPDEDDEEEEYLDPPLEGEASGEIAPEPESRLDE